MSAFVHNNEFYFPLSELNPVTHAGQFQSASSVLVGNQQVSLYLPNLSHHPSQTCECNPPHPPLSPLISSHSLTDSARWLSSHPFSPHPSLPIHQSIYIRYHSVDRVPNPLRVPPQPPVQIPIFPGFFPLLTSTRSTRWWRNNTDTWSYSICALGPGPKSIVMSSPGGGWCGYRGCWGIIQQDRTFWRGSKIGADSNGIGYRTYLLPGPRLPCAKFDIPCNQLISSCKSTENMISVWQNYCNCTSFYSNIFPSCQPLHPASSSISRNQLDH